MVDLKWKPGHGWMWAWAIHHLVVQKIVINTALNSTKSFATCTRSAKRLESPILKDHKVALNRGIVLASCACPSPLGLGYQTKIPLGQPRISTNGIYNVYCYMKV